jgi:uncharacterized lipoprotein NlpE involved in copper resistance
MKKRILLSFISVSILAIVACNNKAPDTKISNKADSTAINNLPSTKDIYVCPMDSDIHSNKPGTCSKCGMDLEKQNK